MPRLATRMNIHLIFLAAWPAVLAGANPPGIASELLPVESVAWAKGQDGIRLGLGRRVAGSQQGEAFFIVLENVGTRTRQFRNTHLMLDIDESVQGAMAPRPLAPGAKVTVFGPYLVKQHEGRPGGGPGVLWLSRGRHELFVGNLFNGRTVLLSAVIFVDGSGHSTLVLDAGK